MEPVLRVWKWLRKWGTWIAGPAVALFVVLSRRRAPVPVDLSKKEEVEKKTAEEEKAAEAQAEQEKVVAVEAHEEGLSRELEKERADAVAVAADEGNVNEFVRDAGKAARGDKS